MQHRATTCPRAHSPNMAFVERVIFLFNYYDQPLDGVSVGPDGARHFCAVFRDDVDEYDSVYNTLALDHEEQTQFLSLFEDARVSDPACWDPARKAHAQQ